MYYYYYYLIHYLTSLQDTNLKVTVLPIRWTYNTIKRALCGLIKGAVLEVRPLSFTRDTDVGDSDSPMEANFYD